MRIFIFFIASLWSFAMLAQDENLQYRDFIYKDNIKSVRFHLDGLYLSYPIIDLNSSAQLILSFDDMDGDVKDYTYTFVHCNKDWTPSDLLERDYLDGYSEEFIDDYDFAFNTYTSYTHFWLILPNEDMRFTKSGNYLLKVYDDDDGTLAITRRFLVVDSQFEVIPTAVNPTQVEKSKTHHEIDFRVIDKNEKIQRPAVEITASLIQNGRWDNAIENLSPTYVRNRSIIFDYQDKITFLAGKEFRYFDIRTLNYRSNGVATINQYEDRYEVLLEEDKKRPHKAYLFLKDANGQFIIENIDRGGNSGAAINIQPLNNRQDNTEREEVFEDVFSQDRTRDSESNIRSDYAFVQFYLESPSPIYEQDVYIFGALTDWRIQEDYKMQYDDVLTAYTAEVLLKQGRYDYIYVTVPNGEDTYTYSTEETEGSWYEASNDYSILIYYRPFGTRYDQLVSVYTFSIPD